MRYVYLVTAFLAVLTVSVFGFRGRPFTTPPIDVFPEWAFPGMKYQPKFRPQSESTFFADGRADRPIPANTVARGDLRADDALYAGKDSSGAWVRGIPAALTVDGKFLERGRERYSIYCAPCHGMLGDGKGIISGYGMNVPTYHDDRRRGFADGEIFDIITNGSQTKLMKPYADKLAADDRWAVVAYVRALQRAENANAADAAATGVTLP